METVFKVGDKVFRYYYGWGEILQLSSEWVEIRFKDSTGSFMGFDYISFTEYTLQGFSQERPTKKPEIGSLCLFSDNKSDFENNIGVVGILKSSQNLDSYRYEHGSGGFFKFCKQIEIKDI